MQQPVHVIKYLKHFLLCTAWKVVDKFNPLKTQIVVALNWKAGWSEKKNELANVKTKHTLYNTCLYREKRSLYLVQYFSMKKTTPWICHLATKKQKTNPSFTVINKNYSLSVLAWSLTCLMFRRFYALNVYYVYSIYVANRLTDAWKKKAANNLFQGY